MNYSNWQTHHKQAYANRGSRNNNQNSNSYKPLAPLSTEEIHRNAWVKLMKICSLTELRSLENLAFEFDTGLRRHDTDY